jgi:hypothetical protein
MQVTLEGASVKERRREKGEGKEREEEVDIGAWL